MAAAEAATASSAELGYHLSRIRLAWCKLGFGSSILVFAALIHILYRLVVIEFEGF